MVVPPYRTSVGAPGWITVPPQGYGGIQWVCAHLIAGLIDLGHEVELVGAPDSPGRPGLTVLDVTAEPDVAAWAAQCDVDVVHDHSNALAVSAAAVGCTRWISTHHLTGPPREPVNCVYVSRAQRRDAGAVGAAVVPLPVALSRYRFRPDKEDFLLFLGRVSAHKGAYEAAAFAAAAGRRLVLAGPSWELDYLARILADHGDVVDIVGETGGQDRLELLSRAAAVLVLSQRVPGPWGGTWAEPGATVVSEAAASGTPVVATPNGCLPEIVPGVGVLVAPGTERDPAAARAALAALPEPAAVRAAARRWAHDRVAARYVDLYKRVRSGRGWGAGRGSD
jgi:glycosyltransferase involved in cell wall biosynthesis